MDQLYDLKIIKVRHEISLPNIGITRSGEFAGFEAYEGTTDEKFAFFKEQYLHSLNRTVQLSEDTNPQKSISYKELLKSIDRRGLDFYQLDVISTISNLKQLLHDEQKIRIIKFSNQSPWLKQGINFYKRKIPLVLDEPYDTRDQMGQSSENTKLALDDNIATAATAIIPSYLLCPFGTENNCPPDATWVPAFWAYQADVYSTCYFGFDCNTNGSFTSTLQWSPLQVNNPYDARPKPSSFIVNTSAFSGPSKGPGALPECNPLYRASEDDAPCQNNNGILVPDPGYETGGNIPNPTCQLARRTGMAIDSTFGCYYYSSWESELPGAYIDTSFLDGSNYYSATVGSSAAHLIQPGIAYTSTVNFFATYFGEPLNLSGQTLTLEGQIGTPDETYTSCIFGMTWCLFAIDITPISSVLF